LIFLYQIFLNDHKFLQDQITKIAQCIIEIRRVQERLLKAHNKSKENIRESIMVQQKIPLSKPQNSIETHTSNPIAQMRIGTWSYFWNILKRKYFILAGPVLVFFFNLLIKI